MRGHLAQVLYAVGIAISLLGVSMLPGLRLSQVAHEVGHALAAIVTGNEVVGIVLHPTGSAATYTTLDPLNDEDLRSQIVAAAVLSAGTLGAALFTAGMLLAVSRMQTGRRIAVSVAAALAAVVLCLVPDDAQLVALGNFSADAGAYTRTYSTVTACILLAAALPGGTVTRATAYLSAMSAMSGLLGDIRELWIPSQHPTDADLAALLTSTPVDAWRGGWTLMAALVVVWPLVALARSPNGWLLRPIRGRRTHS